ncbi:biotin--[acetyl-CoA-carboxylase] ligase, partial [Pedobacter sp. HMWF019]
HKRLYRFQEQHKYRHNGEVFFASIQGVRDTGMLVLLEGETEKEYNFKEIEFLN